MMVSWVMCSVDTSLKSTFGYVDNVKDLWDDIKELFATPDVIRMHELKAAISRCKQTGTTVAAYYGAMKSLWDEYESYRLGDICECGHCKCKLDEKRRLRIETEKIHEFLMALDDGLYGQVRTNILTMDPIPSLRKI